MKSGFPLLAAQPGLHYLDSAATAQIHRSALDAMLRHETASRANVMRGTYALAEELTRSFLPGYVKELLVPIPGLSPQMVVGLPIALFMLIVALGQPYFGVLAERWGTRKTMLYGAAVAAVGFLASAMAHNVLDLLLWRSLCAVGYAMVFVAGQAFVLDHATPANRARRSAVTASISAPEFIKIARPFRRLSLQS